MGECYNTDKDQKDGNGRYARELVEHAMLSQASINIKNINKLKGDTNGSNMEKTR